MENDVTKLAAQLQALSDAFYSNNFVASQDFNKYVRFNGRVKLPHLASLTATCEVGELCEFSGKAYICSAANTWTIIGTQS